ncbi:MAG: hypothetical protein J7599_23650 [Niabella sp.]|nr:hypothetical protein [Niabella sp.]
MKQKQILALAIVLAAGCSKKSAENTDGPHANVTARAVVNATVNVDWSGEQQTIDGFGTFAGRATPLFESPKRDSVMAMLWGTQGLQLNIARGKILHTYPFDSATGSVTISPIANVDGLTAADPTYQALNTDQRDEVSYLWILKKLVSQYHVPTVFSTAWTPPVAWKTYPTASGQGPGFSYVSYSPKNKLLTTRYNDFARYIAGFIKAFQAKGVTHYAISPANEPSSASEWDGCVWTGTEMGGFIKNNLKPEFTRTGLSTKIIGGEDAQWKQPGGLSGIYIAGSDKFNRDMQNAAGSANYDILAGHGYSDPNLSTGQVTYNVNPTAWTLANTTGKRVWQNEICETGNYDASMADGLQFATSIHQFLTTAKANAFVYWLGMLASGNNESLLHVDGTTGNLVYRKVYDVLGQYSRYIKAGDIRMNTTTNNSTLFASAYKNAATGTFAIVVTNNSADTVNITLSLSNATAGGLIPYLTSGDSNAHWAQQSTVNPGVGGKYTVTVPPSSVTTFTGKKI